MKLFAIFSLLLSLSVSANEPSPLIPPSRFQAECGVREIEDALSHQIDPVKDTSSQSLPKIDLVSGACTDEEIDLVVAGCEPISIKRFYSHMSGYDPRYGGWIFNPECYGIANFEFGKSKQFVTVGNSKGAISTFDSGEGHLEGALAKGSYRFDLSQHSQTTSADGKTSPLNTKISFHRANAKGFSYHGEIVDGDGTRRRFFTPFYQWLETVYIKTKGFSRKFGEMVGSMQIDVDAWTPFQLLIDEEVRPSGNIICYTYQPWQPLGEQFAPQFKLLKEIVAYNKTRTKVLGRITFDYKQDPANNVYFFSASGSDNRSVLYDCRPSNPLSLSDVCKAGAPREKLAYSWTALTTKSKPHGIQLLNQYETKIRPKKKHKKKFKQFDPTVKVTAQLAPIGSDGALCPIGSYKYLENSTEVLDGENQKTIYHFDKNKRIAVIENYSNGCVCRFEKNEWDEKTGNLLSKTIAGKNGELFQKISYCYDENQNPIAETTGNLTGSHTIHRLFSKDGFNLKIAEWDDFGKKTTFSYVPQTNLLEKELLWENGKIRSRKFQFYDDCAVCVKTIIDDGQSENWADLTHVSYRKITEVTPKQTLPCFGLPEVVLEKTIDENHREILLKAVKYTYTNSGKVLSEDHYDALGTLRFTLTNEYDADERLVASTNALGARTVFGYDANFNLTGINGPRPDDSKKILYDHVNRPVLIESLQSGNGQWKKIYITYDKCGRAASQTNELGHKTSFVYDSLGRLIKKVFADGTCEEKEFDLLGNAIKEIDANGNITEKTYNFRNQVTSIAHPDGSFEQFSYHPNGQLDFHVDVNGAKSVFRFDCFNHPLEKKTYSSDGKLLKQVFETWAPFFQTSATDAMGRTTLFKHDFAGRKIKEQLMERVTTYEYDELGRECRRTEGEVVTLQKYDLQGQPIEKKVETRNGAILRFEEYAYDLSGNQTHVTTSKGTSVTLYDNQKNPLTSTDPLGYATTFTYEYGQQFVITEITPKGISCITIHDQKNRPIEYITKNKEGVILQKTEKILDGNGNALKEIQHVFEGGTEVRTIIHEMTYGPKNRLEKRIEAGTKETCYLYDTCGRLKAFIKPDKTSLNFIYNELGLLVRYFSTDFDTHYSYNAEGQVVQAKDAITTVTTTREYDSYGCLCKETLGNGLIISSTYDCSGKRQKQIFPDGSEVTYTYKGNDLFQISRKNHTTIYRERDLEGNVTKIELPKALGMLTIERDALSRIKTFRSPHFRMDFPSNAYDSVGNLYTYTYTDPSGAQTENYLYDSLDQLTAENEHRYSYDSIYNRVVKDNYRHTTNLLNQITCDGQASYTYDLNGNLISDENAHYTYDTQDRLIKVVKGKTTIQYTYDAFHRRLSKKIDSQKPLLFLWDGDHDIGSSDGKKLLELRVLGEGLGAEIGAATQIELNGVIYIPLHDHRGCITILLDSYGKPKETYRYNAFGEQTTAAQLSPWRFSSKRLDIETGMYFFGRRYYKPSLGRWITADPQGFKDGPNLYAYVKNDPLSSVDLYGLRSMFLKDRYQGDWYRGYLDSNKGGPYNWYSFEDAFENKSFAYSLSSLSTGREYSDLKNGMILYVNGIKNAFDDSFKTISYLSELSGGKNIHCVYNATHGFLNDAFEVRKGLARVSTTSVQLMHEKLDNFFSTASDTARCLLICHSKGGVQSRNMLQNCNEKYRDRIDVLAIASAAYISEDICGSVRHDRAKFYRDIVPHLDRKGKALNRKTTFVHESHPDAPYFDHSIMSPTYKSILEKQLAEFIKKYD